MRRLAANLSGLVLVVLLASPSTAGAACTGGGDLCYSVFDLGTPPGTTESEPLA